MKAVDSLERGVQSPLLLKESEARAKKKRELGVPMKREEERSLLIKSESTRNYNDETSSEAYQEPQLRHTSTDWKAPAIILGFECLESTAFNGIGTNLVLYLRTVLNGSNASNAANVATWQGTSYFTPVIGAAIADTLWGNYKTICISLIMYLLGMILISFSAYALTPSSALCEAHSCQTANGTKTFMFFCGLYLVAFGSGGVRSALLPFGAQQFNDENPIDREKKGSFFSWFYVSLIFGAIISSTFIVWIQDNIDWALGFGIATVCIILAFGGFLLGRPTYRLQTPSGSPLKSICQVLIASFRKLSVEVPTDSNLLYKGNYKCPNNTAQLKLVHTNEFRFLDKAATIHNSDVEDSDPESPWKICTVTQVEELKILLRFVPVWATSIIQAAAFSQMHTTFVQQGSAMDNRFRSFSIPPASLYSFEVLSVIAWVLLYNKVLVPIIRCCFAYDLSQLQRMGIGRFLITIGMATAAFLERTRLDSAKNGELISIAWQLPQYSILAVTEVFNNITQLEFFFGQAPESMKSTCTAFALLTIALGHYLNSLIITLVAATTTTKGNPGWLPDDLNKGHLDYFFWCLTGICTMNFIVYLAFAKNYTLKKVVSGS